MKEDSGHSLWRVLNLWPAMSVQSMCPCFLEQAGTELWLRFRSSGTCSAQMQGRIIELYLFHPTSKYLRQVLQAVSGMDVPMGVAGSAKGGLWLGMAAGWDRAYQDIS